MNVVMIKIMYEKLFILCVKLFVYDEIINNRIKIFVML